MTDIVSFDDVDLKFINRKDIHTYFSVNKLDYSEDNFNNILECIAFYTFSLFQTDSHEQEIMYKTDNEYYEDEIINVIKRKIYSKIEYPDPEKNPHYFYDHVCGVSEYKKEKTIKKYKEIKQDVAILTDTDLDSKDLKDIEDKIRNKIVKYNHNNDTKYYVARIENAEKGEERKVWDLYTNNKLKTKVLEVINEEGGECAGNFGDFLDHKLTAQDYIDIKKQMKNMHSSFLLDYVNDVGETARSRYNYDINKNKYTAFNFDNFEIKVKKTEQDMYIAYLEIKSEIDQDTDTQNDSESSDSGIHHAASMWVHTCLVEKPDVNLKNTILAINEIEIHVKYSDNTILFDTVYYATDCLWYYSDFSWKILKYSSYNSSGSTASTRIIFSFVSKSGVSVAL